MIIYKLCKNYLMNKTLMPALLVATIMVAGAFAFAPVEQASTVHLSGTTVADTVGTSLTGITVTDDGTISDVDDTVVTILEGNTANNAVLNVLNIAADDNNTVGTANGFGTQVTIQGEISDGTIETFATLVATSLDITAGSVDTSLALQTVVADTVTTELIITGTTINAATNTFQEAGVDISPIGKQEAYISAADCVSTANTPAGPAKVALSAVSAVNAFTLAANDELVCYWQTPTNYDAGTNISVSVAWTSVTAASSGDTVDYLMAAQGYADDSALITAFATGAAIARDTIGTVEEDLQYTASTPIAPAGADASGNLLGIEIELQALSGTNDEILFTGLVIDYTIDAATTD